VDPSFSPRLLHFQVSLPSLPLHASLHVIRRSWIMLNIHLASSRADNDKCLAEPAMITSVMLVAQHAYASSISQRVELSCPHVCLSSLCLCSQAYMKLSDMLPTATLRPRLWCWSIAAPLKVLGSESPRWLSGTRVVGIYCY
jgi:hypothetical protein